MARACIVCSHPDRAAIDASLAGGARLVHLEAAHGISANALSRHGRNHLSTVLRGLVGGDSVDVTDLIDRLVRSLNDLEAVRQAALMSGNASDIIRAAAASNALIGTLLDRLGVDDLSVAGDIRVLQKFATAVGWATRSDPHVGRLVAEKLRAQNLHEDARALEQLAQQVEDKRKEIEK